MQKRKPGQPHKGWKKAVARRLQQSPGVTNIIRSLQALADTFPTGNSSKLVCLEAAELIAVLDTGNRAICDRNDELMATMKKLLGREQNG